MAFYPCCRYRVLTNEITSNLRPLASCFYILFLLIFSIAIPSCYRRSSQQTSYPSSHLNELHCRFENLFLSTCFPHQFPLVFRLASVIRMDVWVYRTASDGTLNIYLPPGSSRLMIASHAKDNTIMGWINRKVYWKASYRIEGVCSMVFPNIEVM